MRGGKKAAGEEEAPKAKAKAEKEAAAKEEKRLFPDSILPPGTPETPPNQVGEEQDVCRGDGWHCCSRGSLEFEKLPPPEPGCTYQIRAVAEGGQQIAKVVQKNTATGEE